MEKLGMKLSDNNRGVIVTTFEKIKQLKVELKGLKVVVMFAGTLFY